MEKIRWKSLAASLALSLGAGAFAGILTADSMKQYKNMYHPPLSPPGWVFPVVWTILYILMGVAAWLVWTSDSEEKRRAMKLYLLQLIANVAWSVIFFGFNAYLVAFAWLLLLWYLIWMTMKEFGKINPTAGRLLLPYLLWVTFAGYLNLAIAVHYLTA